MSKEPDFNPYASPSEAFDLIAAFGSKETLLSVAQGLNLVYWGIGITLLAVMGGVLAAASFRPTSLSQLQVLQLFVLAGVLAGVAVGMWGRITCLKVPEETGARPMIVGAVVCDVIAIGLSVATHFTGKQSIAPVTNLVQLAASVLFVLFLARVANFLRESDLEARARSLIILGVVSAVLGVVTIAGALARSSPLAALAGLGMIVIVLFAFLRYVRLLHDLRMAILRPAS